MYMYFHIYLNIHKNPGRVLGNVSRGWKVHMYIYIHEKYICTYTYIYLYIYTRTFTCIYTYICTHINVDTQILCEFRASNPLAETCIYMHLNIDKHVHLYM